MTTVSLPPDPRKEARRLEVSLGLQPVTRMADIQQAVAAISSLAEVKLLLVKMWVTIEALKARGGT